MPKIVLLLPCHSLEDFPAFHTGSAADELLACWTAPWHPSLLVATGQPPRWQTADPLPERPAADVAWICPSASRSLLPEEWFEDSPSTTSAPARPRLIPSSPHRKNVVGELLRFCQLEVSPAAESSASDFFCLAYWYLQIELLTRQMHFSSHLDVDRFMEHTMAAARAAVAGETQLAEQSLQRSFALLAEQRDHYYPVDAFVIDLTLAAGAATDMGLAAELTQPTPTNLWITGAQSRALASRDAERTSAIREQIAKGHWELVGGEHGEITTPLLPAESWLANLRRGFDDDRSVWGVQPAVYFRRRFGLAGVMPGVLKRAGFVGAIHATLDAGRFPECAQARTTWRVSEMNSIDALGCIPLDASLSETFLKFGLRMGQSMENDYVATVCLAHWAGRTSTWYDDLRRGTRFGMALGRFVTLSDYFRETRVQHPQPAFSVDGYQSPYLREAVTNGVADPITGPQRRWRLAMQWQRLATLAAWAAALGANRDGLFDAWQEAYLQASDVVDDPLTTHASLVAAEESIVPLRQTWADRVTRLIGGEAGRAGWMVLNPGHTASREQVRLVHASSDGAIAAAVDPVYALDRSSDATDVIVDVPGWGYAWLPVAAPGGPASSPANSSVSLVTDDSLRNEFLEARMDETTGGLGGLYDFRTRGNRLGQRLVAVRDGHVSALRCLERKVVTDAPLCGEIESTAEMTDERGVLIGHVTQRFTLWRGSRMLRLRITVDPLRSCTGNPWNDYVACRWALPRGEHRLWRSQHGVRHETLAARCEVPEFFEIEEGPRRTAILAGGLPFHHLGSERMLDSLLLVAGESCRCFEFAVAVDPPQTQALADGWWQPTICVPGDVRPALATGSLFHINSRHVMATGWEPIWADHGSEDARCVGLRIRLLETSGRIGDVELRMPRSLQSAGITNFLGKVVQPLKIEEGKVQVSLGPGEWTEVECHW